MCGALLVLMSVVVAVQTLVEPLYYRSSAERPYSPLWAVLGWLIFVALALALALGVALAYSPTKAAGGDAVTREFVAANVHFYGGLFFGILFAWNWFNQLSPGFTRGRERHRQPCVLPTIPAHGSPTASTYRMLRPATHAPLPPTRNRIRTQALASASPAARSRLRFVPQCPTLPYPAPRPLKPLPSAPSHVVPAQHPRSHHTFLAPAPSEDNYRLLRRPHHPPRTP